VLEPDAAAPGVLAPLVLVTGVSGTGIVVVTILCVGTRSTGAVGTDVSHGALVAIVASRRIVTVDAAEVRIAAVVSAEFIVVAIEGNRACLAATVGTEIPDGAGIFIIARTVSGSICAARFTIATVFGADVAIIAIHCRAASAKTVGAEVVAGTSITVVASSVGGEMEAANPRIAAVRGAGTQVVAVGGRAGTPPRLAYIVNGASIAVIALGNVGGEGASTFRATAVISAGVIVDAGEGTSACTLPEVALVLGGAEVAVIAGGIVQ
jgi:hypothetical protein